MSKITVEFGENEQRDVIALMNWFKMASALDGFKGLRRCLIKGYYNDGILVTEDGKIATDDEMLTIEHGKSYVSVDYMINEIERIFDEQGIFSLLNDLGW